MATSHTSRCSSNAHECTKPNLGSSSSAMVSVSCTQTLSGYQGFSHTTTIMPGATGCAPCRLPKRYVVLRPWYKLYAFHSSSPALLRYASVSQKSIAHAYISAHQAGHSGSRSASTHARAPNIQSCVSYCEYEYFWIASTKNDIKQKQLRK